MDTNPKIRRLAAWMAAVCGLAVLAATPAASASDVQRSRTVSKIDDAVLAQTIADRPTDFFVVLKPTADL